MRVGDEVFECGAGVPFVFGAVNEVFAGGAAGGLLPVVRGRHDFEVRFTNLIGVEGFEVFGEVAALGFSLLDGVELFENFVYFFR